MTVRELIARRKRKASIVAYSGFALFALGMVLDAGEPWFSVALPGFAVFFSACPGDVWWRESRPGSRLHHSRRRLKPSG